MTNWDHRWLKKAMEVAVEFSKDPSTQVGAIIIGQENDVVSIGYNGFARKVKDLPERYNDRNVKYKMVAHAEINAIIFADRWRLKGSTLYTWPIMPCSNCAAIIINAGIRRVVAPKATAEQESRWGESFALAKLQFEEAGVELLLV